MAPVRGSRCSILVMSRTGGAVAVLAILLGACSSGQSEAPPTTCCQITDASVFAPDAADVSTEAATDAGVVLEDATPDAISDSASQPDAQGPYECPGIRSLTAVPAEVFPSQPVLLGLQTVGAATDIVLTTSCAPCVPCGVCGPCGTIVELDGGLAFLCGREGNSGLVNVTASVLAPPDDAAVSACADAGATTMSIEIVCFGGDTVACFSGDTPCYEADCSGLFCTDVESDPSNCGACGNACGAGETCSSGGCLANPLDAGDGVDVGADAGTSDAPAGG